MKLYLKLFLSLCIFLLSGYNHLSALTSTENCFHFPSKVIGHATALNYYVSLHEEPGVLSATPVLNEEFFATEIEEEGRELVSFKKITERSGYFSSYYHPVSCNPDFTQKCKLSEGVVIGSYSAALYLLFQVFRL